ncbi:MAG: RIP metalloprotease RseP [Candidatus Wenzhouxiangella sp. M2_3B_020]
MEILGSIFWLAVALGLLVTFHEFGHYWVARRCGVGVLRFSVGFGQPLWRRRAANGVEFVIGAIPLGGYVKMLDEREGSVPDDRVDEAFNRKSLGKRAAIVAAGPVFNLIFAVAAFWLMFMIGIPEPRPVVGEVSGIAREAGVEEGDLIVAVADEPVETWTHAILELIPRALDREPVAMTVADRQERRRELRLPLDELGADFREERVLEHIGIQPWRADLPPVIGEVSPDSPAERAGLRAGDRIVAIGGETIDGWRALVERIPAAAGEGAVRLEVARNGARRTVEVEPERIDGRPVIGVRPVEPDDETRRAMERAVTVLRHGPVEAVGEAVGETWRLTSATLGILGRMIAGNASLSNLSGPITIAQMANTSASLGVTRFLFFLGLISLSLAIINLLPIPVLDGGHLLYFLIEWIKGSPVSERGLMIGQSIGLAMIAGLMGIAIFNDILRLFQ